jgi:molecular chaperone GrpE (heat shock protein)
MGSDPTGQPQYQQQQQEQQQQEQEQAEIKRDNTPPADSNSGSTDNAQFSAIDDRLQKLEKSVGSISSDLTSLSNKNAQRHQDAIRGAVTKGQINDLDARLQRIETAISAIQKDMEGKDYKKDFSQLQKQLQMSHSSLAQNIQSNVMESMYHPVTSYGNKSSLILTKIF